MSIRYIYDSCFNLNTNIYTEDAPVGLENQHLFVVGERNVFIVSKFNMADVSGGGDN